MPICGLTCTRPRSRTRPTSSVRTTAGQDPELLGRAKVRYGRLHDARHTAATVLLILGVPERAVMGLMGWSSTAMAACYQHMLDTVRTGVAAQIDGFIWESGNEGSDDDDGASGALMTTNWDPGNAEGVDLAQVSGVAGAVHVRSDLGRDHDGLVRVDARGRRRTALNEPQRTRPRMAVRPRHGSPPAARSCQCDRGRVAPGVRPVGTRAGGAGLGGQPW